MIVYGCRSIEIFLPITAGSALNRRCQSACEMIACGSTPTRSSIDGSKLRPRAGVTPSSGKYDAVTYSNDVRSGSSFVIVACCDAYMATPENTVCSSRNFRPFGYDHSISVMGGPPVRPRSGGASTGRINSSGLGYG